MRDQTDTNTRFAGNIHLVRHGESDLPRKGWLSRAGYDAWWAEYERVGLLEGTVPPDELKAIAEKAAIVVASPIPRASQTAEALAPKDKICIDDLFVEAPLPAPLIFPGFRGTPIMWGILSRFIWWLGYSGRGESRHETEVRARLAADRLIDLAASGKGDVLLCGHGWFIHMMTRELRARGWIRRKRGAKRHWEHSSFASPV